MQVSWHTAPIVGSGWVEHHCPGAHASHGQTLPIPSASSSSWSAFMSDGQLSHRSPYPSLSPSFWSRFATFVQLSTLSRTPSASRSGGASHASPTPFVSTSAWSGFAASAQLSAASSTPSPSTSAITAGSSIGGFVPVEVSVSDPFEPQPPSRTRTTQHDGRDMCTPRDERSGLSRAHPTGGLAEIAASVPPPRQP